MKYILTLLLCFSLLSCSDQSGSAYGSATDAEGYHDSDTEAASETVHVCKGRYAEVFHARNFCAGLNNCKAVVEPVSLNEAKEMGRRACLRCYGF